MGVLSGVVIALIVYVIGGGVLAAHFAGCVNRLDQRVARMEQDVSRMNNALGALSTRVAFSGEKNIHPAGRPNPNAQANDALKTLQSPELQKTLSSVLGGLAGGNGAAVTPEQRQQQLRQLLNMLHTGATPQQAPHQRVP